MAAVAAASIMPEAVSLIKSEPGGLTGLLDSTFMKAFYILFTILFIIGIIVIVAGKYIPGVILTLLSGGIMLGVYFIRTRSAANMAKAQRGSMYGGAESIKSKSIRKLHSILQLPHISDSSEEALKNNILSNSGTVNEYYNMLEPSAKPRVDMLVNVIGDDKIKSLFTNN